MSEGVQQSAGFTQWLAAPAWRSLIPFIALLLVALPAWLFASNLLSPLLKGDDFAFLADCRSGQEPLANLFKPHNTHIVPAFRLITAGVGLLSRTPGNLASNALLANYGALVLVLLLVGHVVAWETGLMSAGFAAMAFVGLNSVIRPATIWYSAGQTLWAAAGCLITLAILQRYRIKPGPIWLGLALISVLLATVFWGGGLTSGYAAAAYVLCAKRKTARGSAVALASLSSLLLLTLAVLTWKSSGDVTPPSAENQAAGLNVLSAFTHTTQAISEKLIAPSLGLDIETTPLQGVLFAAGLALCWCWSWYGRRAVRPLEAAGLTLLMSAYLLGFALRSHYSYENLRSLGWYDTLPLVGLALFLAGWLVPVVDSTPKVPTQPSWRSILSLLGFMAVMLVLQTPRVEKRFIAEAPALNPSELQRFPIPELQTLRAKVLISTLADRQRTSLIRLGLVSTEARRQGISREAIRRIRGPVSVPGWPAALTRIDGLDLFSFPPDQTPASKPNLSGAMRLNLEPVPEIRPSWIDPSDPWPPRAGGPER